MSRLTCLGRGQRIENRREEWGEEKWACTRAIDFWIPPLAWCHVGISHVSDNYPIGVKQNVNNYDSALHAHGDFHGGWSTIKLHGWRDELTFSYWVREIFLIRNHVQQNFQSYAITATFEKQRILTAKETCENQFDNNKANSLFAARRNLLQRLRKKDESRKSKRWQKQANCFEINLISTVLN